MERVVTATESGRTDWEGMLDRAHQIIMSELGQRKLPEAARVLQEMRDERDAQLLDSRRLC
jgi:hypothetical protein